VSLSTSKQRLASNPAVFARELLARLGISAAGDLKTLMSRLQLSIKEVDSQDFEGVLVCRADRSKGIIAVNRNIREDGRKRFAICHEIAHFVLPGHGSDGCICKSEDIESWRKGLPEYEIEANEFASELLLPYKVVAPLVKKDKATIGLAKDIANRFGTSLTAACLKSVEVTEEKCAFVYSVDGSIKWFRRNDNFWRMIRTGQLSSRTFARELFNGSLPRERDGAVPADAWVEDEHLSSDATIWEESLFMPNYNGTITILTIHRDTR
jgi:Zn-dependent peptidase ImmA (M78 family)